jgi:hypothetical protein
MSSLRWSASPACVFNVAAALLPDAVGFLLENLSPALKTRGFFFDADRDWSGWRWQERFQEVACHRAA